MSQQMDVKGIDTYMEDYPYTIEDEFASTYITPGVFAGFLGDGAELAYYVTEDGDDDTLRISGTDDGMSFEITCIDRRIDSMSATSSEGDRMAAEYEYTNSIDMELPVLDDGTWVGWTA